MKQGSHVGLKRQGRHDSLWITRKVLHCRLRRQFTRIEADLKSGTRIIRPFANDAGIATGNFFILGGQMAYVAETGETIRYDPATGSLKRQA